MLNFILQSTIIVDIVKDSITITDGQQFYGLYSKTLQPRCWLSDNETLIINTVQRASIKPYLVNIGTGLPIQKFVYNSKNLKLSHLEITSQK